jgi:peptide/nickel transport system substrate-binding protein
MVGVLLAVISLALVACGAGTGSAGTSSSSKTLRLALGVAPSTLDPDKFYESEGLVAMTAAYQGLLRYENNSPKLEGLLVTGWKESADGLTYTFALRHGVKFSDGTPFNAAAAKASFERRTAIKAGPSYMLEEVKSYATPSPYTFVVHLKRPVAPFLSYLASPYGPLMTSPTALAAHTHNGDHAGAWLETHTEGTGAYAMSSVQHGVKYVMTVNPYYTGAKPYFTRVDFSVVANFATQLQEVEGGSLDGVLHGLTTQAIEAAEKNPALQVQEFPALFQAQIWINPKSAVFGAANVRTALRAALNNKQLTEQAYGPTGTPSTNVYPAGMLPNGLAPDESTYNPSLLAPALAPYKGKKVVIGWSEQSQSENLANLLQVRLQADGLNASVQQFQPSTFYALPEKPELRPDMVVIAFNPDSGSPDTFARIYWYKHAPVNLLGCEVPAADKLLDEASEQTSEKAAQTIGAKAAIAYRDSNCWLNIADQKDTIVLRKGLTGFDHQPAWIYDLSLSSLREE